MVFKIYAITCNITGETYFGSTEQTMEVRMSGHKSQSRRDCSSKQIIDRGDYREEILEEHDYTETEAHERENFYIDNFECINKNRAGIPGRTKKEYYEANKEVLLEKQKEKYEANKEVLLEKQKEYYEANKEVLLEKQKEKYEANKEVLLEKKKEYYEANKEVLLEKQKEYYEANKETISEKGKEKITCVCGSTIRKNGKSHHEKTQKHQAFLNK